VPVPGAGSSRRRALLLVALCTALVLLTFAAFWGVRSAGFVRYDDDRYVTDNARVLGGLTWDNAGWAFSNLQVGFYYPLTWLSHMADVELYGLDAGRHHWTSLLLHVLNVLLLFLALHRMTRAPWRSSLAAALFAVHPLHVESVAWIAERKDVLCTSFAFLCLLAYAFYAEKPSALRYLPVFASLLLGLLAKSMVITLPAVLLLLDVWPLFRWAPGAPAATRDGPAAPSFRPAAARQLLLEKVPLFALVPLFAALTWISQKEMGAVATMAQIPLSQRLANASIACVTYLVKVFAPLHLSVHYPHPGSAVSYGTALLCAAVLLALTAAALGFGRRRRYLAVGWLWYLVTLAPVVGLIQVGNQAMADRYTYLPLVGPFVALAWGMADLAGRRSWSRGLASGVAAAGLVALVVLTRAQVGVWADSETLFRHALAIAPEDPVIQANLGAVLTERGRPAEGIPHLREALRLNPRDVEARNALGNALAKSGSAGEAIEQYREALRARPGEPRPLANLGLSLMKAGRLPEALDLLEGGVRAHPESPELQVALGTGLLRGGQPSRATECFQSAQRLRPGSPEALDGLGQALLATGRWPEAVGAFESLVRSAPDSADARVGLAVALDYAGRASEAIEQFRRALEIRPDSPEIWNNLGQTFGDAGRLPEAIECFQKALALNPEYAAARDNLRIAQAHAGSR